MSATVTRFTLFLAFCAFSCATRYGDLEGSSESGNSEDGWVELLQRTNWPSNVKLGQIGGVAFSGNGNAVVFHRASRKWNDGDFEENGVYKKASDGKIKEKTIAVINSRGKMMDSWGADMFFMPHGLTIDNDGNLWVTDVAAHQVFKFAATDKTKPSLVLGEALKPGSDASHFCQPTDVAVTSTGDFFVADGYCNSRILKFDRNGKLLAQFGTASNEAEAEPGTFNVPHSLALIEADDTLCVADRENQRIQCFDAGLNNASKTGELKAVLAYPSVERVFAIAYDESDELLHGLSVGERSFGFSITLNNPDLPIVGSWSPAKGFNMPHDLAVSPNGKRILVGEVGGNRLVLLEKSR